MGNSPLYEAIKEAGRYAFFIAISAFVSVLSQKLANMPQNDTMIVVLSLGLRMIDKYLYEMDKTQNVDGPKGLLPF